MLSPTQPTPSPLPPWQSATARCSRAPTRTNARAQLKLPMRHGGMGLHRLSPAEGSAAFLSSAALANVAMIGAPEQFWPFDGSASASLRQEWSQLRTHVGLSDPHGQVADDVCLRMVLPQVQTDTSKGTAASHLRSVAALSDGSSPLKRAQRHKARLLSCASPRLATGQTSSVSSKTAFCPPVSP